MSQLFKLPNRLCWCLLKMPAALLMCFLMLGLPHLVRGQQVLVSQWAFSPSIYPRGVAFSADGTLLGVGSGSSLCIYSVSTHLPYQGVQLKSGYVASFQFSPDGQKLAVVTTGGTITSGVEFWSIGTRKFLGEITSSATNISSVAFSPNGETLAIGGLILNATTQKATGIVEAWNVASRTRHLAFRTKATAVTCIGFSRDGKLIAAGGKSGGSGSLELWNYRTGTLAKNLDIADLTSIDSVAFPPDGITVACAANSASEGAVAAWDLATGNLKSEVKGQQAVGMGSVLSPDGTQLAVSGSTSTTQEGQTFSSGWVTLWEASNLQTPAATWYVGWDPPGMAFSADGSKLAATGTTDSWLGTGIGGAYEASGSLFAIWSTAGGAGGTSTTMTEEGFGGAPGAYVQPSFSPDGTLSAGGMIDYGTPGNASQSGLINIWESATGRLVAALPTGAVGGSLSVAFSADDKWLTVSGISSLPNEAELWDIENGTLVGTLGNGIASGPVVFSPKGGLAAVAAYTESGSGVVQIWQFATGKLIETLVTSANAGVRSIAFSKDGSSLAVGGSFDSGAADHVSDGVLELWDVASGERTAQLSTKESVVSGATFSPNGKSLVASGSFQASYGAAATGRIELWSIASGKLLNSLPVFPGTTAVTGTWYSETGKLLYATASGGPGPIQVLDPIQNKLLGCLNAPSNGNLALSMDGKQAAQASANTGLIVCSVPTLTTEKIRSVKLSPASIPEFSSTVATVTLDAPAPAGGLTLGIEVNSPTFYTVGVPSTVTVPAGRISATFTVQSISVVASTLVSITVLSGTDSKSGLLSVLAPDLESFTLNSSTVVGGASLTGTVTLSNPPGQLGDFVDFKVSSSAVDDPYLVFVPSPKGSAAFTLTTHPVATPQTVTITAVFNSTTKTVRLTLIPPHS